MANQYVIPTEKSVTDLLVALYGDDLSVSMLDDHSTNAPHVALFIDDEDKLVGACMGDTAFVAYGGTALSMLPANTANEMIAEGEFSNAVNDNFYEVMNISTTLVMSDKSAHLRLDKVVDLDTVKDEIAALSSDATVVDFSVDIPNYGTGKLRFLVT